MSFPALLDAGDDPLLVQKGSVAVLYLHLVGRLDFVEFRRLRASRVSTDLRMRPETIGAALKVLREAGYIERGERVMDVFTYRLVYARKAGEDASNRKPAPRPAVVPPDARAHPRGAG